VIHFRVAGDNLVRITYVTAANLFWNIESMLMSLEALIVSPDKEVVSAFRRVLSANSINLSLATSAHEAGEILSNRKFDAVIIDCDDVKGGCALLEGIRKGQSNRNAIAFALLNGITTMKQAYDLGSNFVLEKPLTADRISRSVRAGRGLILRERRRYFRYPVGTDVFVTLGDDKEIKGKVLNLSEGGIAVKVAVNGKPTGQIKTRFLLPHSAVQINGKCEVQWVNDGQLGLRFTQLQPESRQELTRWLTRKIESNDPLSRIPEPPQ
jgi:DNA-binding response OmpR family regulator